jgi:hypothetical protein
VPLRTKELFEQIHLLNLYISGIEVTQAIQHHESAEHLTDPADRGSDNSIRLVANKPAWVRVYLGSLFGSSGITGTLEIQRRESGFLFQSVATLNPIAPTPITIPGTLQYNYATTRGALGSTLNFVIPADEMIGTLRLIARASNGSNNVEHSMTVAVTLRQTLRLAGVMISYNGPASSAPNAPNLTIAAPTLADLQAMSGTALTLFPVQSTANFRTAGSLTLTFPLIDAGPFPTSGCGASWDTLHAQVVNARTADGNRPGWIYYGLLPNGVPTGLVGGCGGGGVAVGPINQPGTLAHEAGHACGLDHAPAGGAPNPDPNYPAYEPYDSTSNRLASIGEFGLNINNGIIASPQMFRDFMAYGGPSWISLYHCRRLLENARLNPVTVGIDHFWWKDLVWAERRRWPSIPMPDPPPFDFDLELPVFPPVWQAQDMISLIVRIERRQVAEVMHVARTRMYTQMEHTSTTPFTAHLRGENGQVIAEAPLLRLDVAACGCGGCCGHGANPDHYLAQALIPDLAPGEALVISGGEEVVWERKAPAEPVRVAGFKAYLDRKGELHLEWNASREAVEFWVRWSTDGQSWHSLATGLTGNESRLEASQLPSGNIMLQLIAHDGFFSSASKPVRVKLPERAPEVAILHPVDGHTYVANQALRLWGSVSGLEGQTVATERSVWLLGIKESSRRKAGIASTIGRGLDTWTTLEPGEHKLTLRVDGKGGTAESSVTVVVKDFGEKDKPADQP